MGTIISMGCIQQTVSKFYKNLTVKTKIITIFIIIISVATAGVVAIRAYQIQSHADFLLRERLQNNANMTFGIFNTVRFYTRWVLDITSSHAHFGLTNGTDMERMLTYMYDSMGHIEGGNLIYENIMIFDADFNILAVANPEGDIVDLRQFYAEYGQGMLQFWRSTAFKNPVSGRMQLLFAQPVIDSGHIIGFVAVIGNTEMLQFFLRDLMQIYDSFVNVVDTSGIIFFSNREIYMGRHVDDLGVYEAFNKIPMNIVFEHNSALTGIDKIAYITADPSTDWTIVSFIDAHTVESTAWLIFLSLLPTTSGVLLAAALVVFVVYQSLKPLNILALNAKAIACGNLDVNFDTSKNDEIGQVSRAFLGVVQALNILLNNFKDAEKSMTKGETEYNLSDARLGGIYDEMLDSANNIISHIQNSMHKAQQASKAKSDFLATMSHEIRTPMNAILGIAQIQLQNDKLANEEKSAFQKIYASGSTLLGIINDILDMSKIETGKLELNPVEYNVPSLINDTVQLNNVRIGSKPINFIFTPDENLPSLLFGDELRIKQILNNLLSNAIKYTDEGDVKFSVKSFHMGKDTMLQFVVEDTGQGMKPEDLEKLFSAYSRFNMNDNRGIEGTGIGLTITRKLVEMMDGTVNVKSEFGKGSTFTVRIKQQTVECPPIGKTLAEQLSSFSLVTNTKRAQVVYEPMPYGRILLVDDVETNLYVAEGLLAPYQTKIETAASGFIALEKVSAGAVYDIIFMDHMMPKMDGIETTQKLRDMGYTGTIIALTANALVGNDEKFKSKGFDGFVSKPIDLRQLDAVMKRYVRDKHREETDEQPISAITQVTPFVMSAFLRDAENAVETIRETLESGDMELFIITVHAIKSALNYVNENETSKMAAALEKAGLSGDTAFINANAEALVLRLEELAERFTESLNREMPEPIAS